MGSVISSIFGGGNQYEAPETPAQEPIPVRETAKEPESEAVRSEEQRKIKARRAGTYGNILTSPLGTTGQTNNNANGILGRTM